MTAPAAAVTRDLPALPEPQMIVSRSRRPASMAALFGIVLLVVLYVLPYYLYESFLNTLVNLFILITIATMWNALAGYAGLVSVGQQAYIGVGAYTVLVASEHGVNPFAAIAVAVAVSVVLAFPVSFLVFRLAGAYFAIATWVLAVVADLVVLRFPSLGGGTGAPLQGLSGMGATVLGADTYWAALAVAAVSIVSVYVLLRSRLGLALTAVRDNEIGASGVGCRVAASKRVVYLLASGGCAAAGAMIAISQLDVQPGNVFDVQWTAYMIFAVLIGGLGTIEGPIIGSIVFIVLQQELAQYDAWYLIVLGAIAMAIAIWARRGIWGLFTAKVPIQLFPTGYHLHTGAGISERYGPLRLLLGPVMRSARAPSAPGTTLPAEPSAPAETSAPPDSSTPAGGPGPGG